MAGSAWTNQVQNTVVAAGANSGVFVYNGQPGPGNLPVAWMSESATDPFGNLLPTTGVVSLSGSSWVSLESGQLSFDNGAFIGEQSGPARMVLGGVPLNILTPVASVLAAVHPGTTATAESWQSAGFANSWTGSGSATNGLFYRLTTENVVRIIGDLSSPGTASVITTLPAGYRPATGVNIEFSRYDDSGTAHALVGTDGTITMQTVVGAGKGLFCNAFIPLGSL